MYQVSKSSGRALCYLKRRQRKTTTLALMFFVLCLLSISAAMVQDGVESSLKELREQFFGSLTVESTSAEYRVTPEAAEMAVERLQPNGWTGRSVCYLSMEELCLSPGKFTLTGDPSMYISKIFAGRDSSLAREFTSKEVELTEGRHIQPEDQGTILISETVAELNNLKLGDHITGTVTDNEVIHAQAGIGTEYEFEIVGIFRVLKEDKSSAIPAESDILENMMFAEEALGFSMAEEIWQLPGYYNMGITLWMKDPAELDAALESLISWEEGDWDHYLIRTNSADYDRSAAPMEQMSMLIRLFLLLILAIGALLLTILLIMRNRERMPEIGILLSLGCSKGKVLQQLLTENMVLYFIGFAAAVPASALGGLILRALSVETGRLNAAGIGLVGVAGLALCAAVTCLSTAWIMRKNPMDILVMVV